MTAKTNQGHTQATENIEPRPRSKSTYPPLSHDPDALARLKQCTDFLGIGKSRFYSLVKQGKLPSPRKIGRSSVWISGKIREAAAKLLLEEGAQ